MSVNKKEKIFVIGAGPTGLVASWKLSENNREVHIFEASNRVGGLCSSWEWNDFTLDIGPHIFHTPDKNLEKFWKKEFGDLLEEGKYYCGNIKGENFDEFHSYPISWEQISLYPQKLREMIVKEITSIDNLKKAKASNYKEYMDAQVGPTLRSMFYEKYPMKIWGINPNDMTADWAPKRIQFREKISPFYINEWSAISKKGTGAVYSRIAEKINSYGGKIKFNKKVINLKTSGNIITEIIFSDNSKQLVEPSDIIISSIPITILAKFFNYESKLSFRGVRLGYFLINKDRLLPNGKNWLYYDSEKLLFNRITEPKTMSKSLGQQDKTVIVTETCYSKNDEIDNLTDIEFSNRIISGLKKAFLLDREDILDTITHKEDYVYPVQTAGYQNELAKTRSIIGKYDQLYSLGTGGDFNYADSQILFHMAFDISDEILNNNKFNSNTIKQIKPALQNSYVKLGNSLIGNGEECYIIAEAGLNHNGDVNVAKELIDQAVLSGCSAIKFQSFVKGSRVSKTQKFAKYAEEADGLQENIYDLFERLSLSFEDQKTIFNYASTKNIPIFSTPFDIASVDFLEELGVFAYKIASMDLVNIPLIEYVAKRQKPIILSTGMSTLSNIEDAVNTILKSGNPNIILLHCNSSYPAPEEEMNLAAIETLKNTFKVPVGLSDHTFGLFVSHTAISLGANVIERHFTLSRSMVGPDHILSSELDEMSKLVDIAKRVPKIIGNGIKQVQPAELTTLNMQQKCIYASKNLKRGDKIRLNDIIIKGPGGGILPKFVDIIIGREVKIDIQKDTAISWNDI